MSLINASPDEALGSYAAQKTFFHGGLEFSVYGQVFSPKDFPSSQKFTTWLANSAELCGKTMIEIGGGCGHVGQYLMVKQDMAFVTQGDINPHAVACARDNSQRLGIADRVSVVQSNVFEGMEPGRTADVIYWNHPWKYLNPNCVLDKPIKYSYCDPGYRSLTAYVREAAEHTAPEGRIFLGFSSHGDQRELRKIARNHGYEALVLQQDKYNRREGAVMLYEFVRPSGTTTVLLGEKYDA